MINMEFFKNMRNDAVLLMGVILVNMLYILSVGVLKLSLHEITPQMIDGIVMFNAFTKLIIFIIMIKWGAQSLWILYILIKNRRKKC